MYRSHLTEKGEMIDFFIFSFPNVRIPVIPLPPTSEFVRFLQPPRGGRPDVLHGSPLSDIDMMSNCFIHVKISSSLKDLHLPLIFQEKMLKFDRSMLDPCFKEGSGPVGTALFQHHPEREHPFRNHTWSSPRYCRKLLQKFFL